MYVEDKLIQVTWLLWSPLWMILCWPGSLDFPCEMQDFLDYLFEMQDFLGYLSEIWDLSECWLETQARTPLAVQRFLLGQGRECPPPWCTNPLGQGVWPPINKDWQLLIKTDSLKFTFISLKQISCNSATLFSQF